MENVWEDDFGFLLVIFGVYESATPVLSFLRCGDCCVPFLCTTVTFLYPDMVILDVNQLMCLLFLKIRTVSEESLLHLWYDWNISFTSLTSGILFPWATIWSQELKVVQKTTGSLLLIKPCTATLDKTQRKITKQGRLSVWTLCGHQKSFREKRWGRKPAHYIFEVQARQKVFLL